MPVSNISQRMMHFWGSCRDASVYDEYGGEEKKMASLYVYTAHWNAFLFIA